MSHHIPQIMASQRAASAPPTQHDKPASADAARSGAPPAHPLHGASPTAPTFLTRGLDVESASAKSVWAPEMKIRHKRDTKAYLASPPRVFSKSPTRDEHSRLAGLYDGSAAYEEESVTARLVEAAAMNSANGPSNASGGSSVKVNTSGEAVRAAPIWDPHSLAARSPKAQGRTRIDAVTSGGTGPNRASRERPLLTPDEEVAIKSHLVGGSASVYSSLVSSPSPPASSPPVGTPATSAPTTASAGGDTKGAKSGGLFTAPLLPSVGKGGAAVPSPAASAAAPAASTAAAPAAAPAAAAPKAKAKAQPAHAKESTAAGGGAHKDVAASSSADGGSGSRTATPKRTANKAPSAAAAAAAPAAAPAVAAASSAAPAPSSSGGAAPQVDKGGSSAAPTPKGPAANKAANALASSKNSGAPAAAPSGLGAKGNKAPSKKA
jgi:hypothetical protein